MRWYISYTRQKKNSGVKTILKKWRIILISLLMVVFVSACGAEESPNESTGPTVEEGDTRIAAVGDSITNYGIAGANYPDHLEEMLGEGYTVENFGEANYAAQSFSDFPYETTSSYEESLAFDPEIVLFMLGTNDTKANNWEGQETFKSEYTDLLEDYLDLESVSRVILASPPTVFLDNVMQGSIDPTNIEPIRNVVAEVAEEYDLEFVDMMEATAGHPEWFTDGIHPNEEGAEQLATVFYEQITQ